MGVATSVRFASAAGPIMVVVGAWVFAGANATAKALYQRESTNLLSLLLLRSLVVYLMNALIVAVRRQESVRGVLLLKASSRHSGALLGARSTFGAGGISLLNLAFGWYLTFADAFAIFMGATTMASILGARAFLGSSERLGLSVMCGGFVTVGGIVLITQPPALFGAQAGAEPPSANGVMIAVCAALLLSSFSLLTRVLTRRDGPHRLSPATLLSWYMVVLGAFAATVALAAHTLLPSPVPAWARIMMPTAAVDAVLFAGYNLLIVSGQVSDLVPSRCLTPLHSLWRATLEGHAHMHVTDAVAER